MRLSQLLILVPMVFALGSFLQSQIQARGYKIVHVVRDGRDCVSSLKTMPWWNQSSIAAMATWANAIDAGRAAARKYGPQTYHELPQMVMRAIS